MQSGPTLTAYAYRSINPGCRVVTAHNLNHIKRKGTFRLFKTSRKVILPILHVTISLGPFAHWAYSSVSIVILKRTADAPISLRKYAYAALIYLGPVVQSVVSLTSSLRVISLTVLVDSIYNILIFSAEKMRVAFKSYSHFFQRKISAYLPITRCKF